MAAASVRPQLTRVSFRRDVRFFLAILVGFLIVVIFVLVMVLLDFVEATRGAIADEWDTIADVVAARVEGKSDGVVRAEAASMQSQYAVAGVELLRPDGSHVLVGIPSTDSRVATVSRPTPSGMVHIMFDRTDLDQAERRFHVVGAVAFIATFIGAILLLLYLPRITRPIEEMLVAAEQLEPRDPNVDERDYLVQSFRSTIERMQAHEAELQRLHDLQKSRADDLERVSGALTRSLTSGLIALDPEGRVVEVNQVAREILGVSGDTIGQSIANAFGESDFTRLLEQAFTERRALSRIETAVGPQIVGVTTVPLVNDDGALLGMLALFTDLTRIHDLESRVREMQALADLGEMSAGIAHEFRNSLSTILGFMTMSRRAASSEESARAIENARTEATQLNQAVEGLLAFARPMRLDTQPVDLLALMREIVERFDDVELTGEPSEISGDPNLLRRAMENLVRNAVESVKQKGSGSVHVHVANKRVTIEDSGIGLDPADVPRLLLPFQSDKPAGYGLGLPLARKIILLHDGTFSLTGRPGEGATAYAEFV